MGVPLILFQLQEILGGTCFPQETLQELVAIDQVVAIKEASFDAMRFRETLGFLRGLKKKITVLTGNDNFILESFILGAEGALIGFGSVFPGIQVKAIRLMQEKNWEKAFSVFAKIDQLCRFCFQAPVRKYRSRMKEVLVQQTVLQTRVSDSGDRLLPVPCEPGPDHDPGDRPPVVPDGPLANQVGSSEDDRLCQNAQP